MGVLSKNEIAKVVIPWKQVKNIVKPNLKIPRNISCFPTSNRYLSESKVELICIATTTIASG